MDGAWALLALELNPLTLPQQLVNGLLTGAIYALVALGYTMVYGVLRLINFAHGEVFMLGAYTALLTSWTLGYYPNNPDLATKTGTPLDLVIMILMAMTVCALLGVAIERFAYRPLRNQSRTVALITAIGVSLFLQFLTPIFLPASPPPSISDRVNPYSQPVSVTLVPGPAELERQVPALREKYETAKAKFDTLMETEKDQFNLSPAGRVIRTEFQEAEREYNTLKGELSSKSVVVNVTVGKLVMLGTVLVLMAMLRYLVLKTPMGRAMRAVSHDFDSAGLMGINVNKVITFTFALGSALAGAGAMMLATFEGTAINGFFGVQPGIKAFVAAVLGGIGNIPGAVLGGILMGVAEALVTWAGFSGYKDAVAFIILIVILLFRPGGLLGSNKVEKV